MSSPPKIHYLFRSNFKNRPDIDFRAMAVPALQIFLREIGRSLRICPVILFVALMAAAPPLRAQDTQPTEIPDPPPSVNDYSLPAGPATPAEPRAEGPVEENAPPPRQISPAATEDTPTAVTPTRPPTEPSAQPSGTTASSERRRPEPQPRRAAEPPVVETPAPPEPIADDPDVGPASEPETAAPVSEAVETAAPTDGNSNPNSPAQADTRNQTSITFLIGGVLLLLLGSSALLAWHRRRNAPEVNRETYKEPTQSNTHPISKQPTVKAAKDNNPKECPSPAFVSFKTAKQLSIEFVAEKVGTTLLNAVLDYRVTLTNDSDEGVNNVRLLGTMMQADESAMNGGTEGPDVELHQIAELGPGKSVTITGEMRLPLSKIYPIKVKQQTLFIPLARFGVEYSNQANATQRQTATFLIGQEHQPPRARMAPFRLDLGPRNFSPVGHRPLSTG